MFKRELKINFKSLILWSIILLAIYILIYGIYPSLINEETKESLSMMMETMPQEMLSAFNMDIVGIESAFGWFRTEGYVFLTLIGGLYSAILGSTILLKEESEKTIEFLYAKPVSRKQIVSAKILCGIINIFIFTAIITVGNYIGLFQVEDFDTNQFFMISIIPILLYYMLFFICLFISIFLKKSKKAMTLGIGIVFLSYFMQIIGSMGENIEWLKNISLFEFASSRYIVLNNHINMTYLWIGIGIIFLTIIGTYYRYENKEFK